jgi:hypothetical protein
MEMLNIPERLRTENNGKSLYLLLCHSKVSLRTNTIRSEYAALLKGVLAKMKLPYFSIFYKTFKLARARFFEEEIIQFLWRRFLQEKP